MTASDAALEAALAAQKTSSSMVPFGCGMIAGPGMAAGCGTGMFEPSWEQ